MTEPNDNGKWVFNEIVNNVAGMIEKLIVTRQERTTTETPSVQVETTDVEEPPQETQETQEEEEVNVVQRFFEKLNTNNGNTLKPLQKEADKEIGGKIYSSWNPLGEISNDTNAEDERYHTGPIIFSGILMKQGRKPNIWKERFFILRETGLSYYTHIDPFTIDAVKYMVDNNKEPKKGSLPIVHKNTIQITRGKGRLKGAQDSDLKVIDRLKKKKPVPRGNIFFVDCITPRGRIIEDLNWLSDALKGNKQNAFLIQTHHSMFSLAAQNEDDKILWEKQISRVYDKFIKTMIRKVAIMELAWSFGEEISNAKVKKIEDKKSLKDNEEIGQEKKEGFFKRTKRRGSMLFNGKKSKKTLKKGLRKDVTLISTPGKNNGFLVQTTEVEAVAESEPNNMGKIMFRNIFRKTLERTKKKMLTDLKETTEDRAVKKRIEEQVKTAGKKARGSLKRMGQKDRLRLSTKRVGVVLEEAVQGLTNKLDEQIQIRREKKLIHKSFIGWLYYYRLVKLSRTKALVT